MGRATSAEGCKASSQDAKENGKVTEKEKPGTKKTLPKTAKEALLMLPKTRRKYDALSPEEKAVALKGMQRMLDQAR